MNKLFYVLILMPALMVAQVTQEWVQRYNGPVDGNDVARIVKVDALGNVYVTGHGFGIGSNIDYVTIKYNSSGVIQWVQRYNGLIVSGPDYAFAMAIDDSSNVIVTGRSSGISSDDFATIKYNTFGVQQWVQRYNSGDDVANSISIDQQGNVYVTGPSWLFETENDYATVKYNSMGVQQWVHKFNWQGNSNDYPHSMDIDDSGNVFVTGSSFVNANIDCLTIKYNSLGILQWAKRYNGPANSDDIGNSIIIDPTGFVYVTGFTGGSNSDYLTIKYNSAGTEQWVQFYNGSGSGPDFAHSIKVDLMGNILVTGEGFESGTYYDYTTIKYNSSGIQQWVQRYNGPANNSERVFNLVLDELGNVYVTGHSFGIYDDYATVKYNSSGVEQWVQRYNGTGNNNDWAYSIVVDNLGNVYVTGTSDGTGTLKDYATIKYSQTIGIKQISTEVPEKFSLEQNYPNPFNPVTRIKFDVPTKVNSNISLRIFDVLGREVEILVNESLKPGTYEAEWDANNFSTGIYFYTLLAEDFRQTKRMVLVK
ncbi:MAG: SBBP repeat-containing protein [Chlorobi bacterium]|nr:SBBP repeat-containing protein [Chlorobiota bacterium]